MMKTRKALNERLRIAFVLGVALMWTLGVHVVAESRDKKPASPVGFAEASVGHDHAAHAEGDTNDEHADEARSEDEHGEHDGHDHKGEVHEDEDDHSGHDHAASSASGRAGHADEEEGLRLTPEQRKRFGIVVRQAGPGSLRNEVRLPGEIVFNEDRVVHLVPRVAGIAREVHKTVGDRVNAEEVLAVIESRELSDAKSEYLTAKARAALAENSFEREKALREKQVSSEQDFLEAEQAFSEARIVLRSAEQKLHALGLTETAINALGDERGEAITRYEIRSPIDGVMTERHIALGESLEADADIFTIVDTGSVWVNLTVYTKDLAAVRKGQEVVLRSDHSGVQARGKIAMVTPFVDESTRSATARVVLDNSDDRWIPGTFITGSISVSEKNIDVMVPKGAVQVIEGRSVVFVEHEGAFEMTPVATGRADRENIEILTGLKAGEPYVTKGAFELKATVITSNLGSHAGHGH